MEAFKLICNNCGSDNTGIDSWECDDCGTHREYECWNCGQKEDYLGKITAGDSTKSRAEIWLKGDPSLREDPNMTKNMTKHHILKGHALAVYICPGCWYEALIWRKKFWRRN